MKSPPAAQKRKGLPPGCHPVGQVPATAPKACTEKSPIKMERAPGGSLRRPADAYHWMAWSWSGISVLILRSIVMEPSARNSVGLSSEVVMSV